MYQKPHLSTARSETSEFHYLIFLPRQQVLRPYNHLWPLTSSTATQKLYTKSYVCDGEQEQSKKSYSHWHYKYLFRTSSHTALFISKCLEVR